MHFLVNTFHPCKGCLIKVKGTESEPAQDKGEERTKNLQVRPHRSPYFFQNTKALLRYHQTSNCKHLSGSISLMSIVVISVKMFIIKALSSYYNDRGDVKRT